MSKFNDDPNRHIHDCVLDAISAVEELLPGIDLTSDAVYNPTFSVSFSHRFVSISFCIFCFTHEKIMLRLHRPSIASSLKSSAKRVSQQGCILKTISMCEIYCTLRSRVTRNLCAACKLA
jgi:hypothetical protein